MARPNPLRAPELLELILDHVAPYPVVELGRERETLFHKLSTEERRTFKSLALTCRATSEPALDRLWRSLDSLEHVYTEWKDPYKPPSLMDFFPTSRHTIRVRQFYVREVKEWGSIPLSDCLDTGNPGPRRFLLPNLRLLIMHVEGVDPHRIMPMLAPTLVSLDIISRTYICLPIETLKVLLAFCPNLEAFKLDTPYVPNVNDDDMDAFYQSIRLLRKIENLQILLSRIHMVPKDIILSPNFKVFSSSLPKIDIEPEDTPFPNVEVLHLITQNLDFITSLLRPHQQFFRVITIEIRSHFHLLDPSSMFSYFHGLVTPKRAESLESFELTTLPDSEYFLETTVEEAEILEENPTRYCVTPETLSPLTSFSRLRRLVIWLDNQISLDDVELENLVRGWPLMESLCLQCRSGGWPWALAKYPTLNGLLALISACPRLRKLAMPINARIVPVDASADICNKVTNKVMFNDSLISDPRQVIDFFRKHLPSLEMLTTSECPSTRGELSKCLEECEKMWKVVEDEFHCPGSWVF